MLQQGDNAAFVLPDPDVDAFPRYVLGHFASAGASEMPYPEAFRQTAVMIKRIGQKIDLFKEYSQGEDVKPKQMNEAALDFQIELAGFFSTVIRFFRHEGTSGASSLQDVISRRAED